MTIEFEIIQTRIKQDCNTNVPDTIYEQGHEAIEKWLFDTGVIDNSLDYAETETKVKVYL